MFSPMKGLRKALKKNTQLKVVSLPLEIEKDVTLLSLDQQQACLFLQWSIRQLFDMFRCALGKDYFAKEC